MNRARARANALEAQERTAWSCYRAAEDRAQSTGKDVDHVAAFSTWLKVHALHRQLADALAEASWADAAEIHQSYWS